MDKKEISYYKFTVINGWTAHCQESRFLNQIYCLDVNSPPHVTLLYNSTVCSWVGLCALMKLMACWQRGLLSQLRSQKKYVSSSVFAGSSFPSLLITSVSMYLWKGVVWNPRMASKAVTDYYLEKQLLDTWKQVSILAWLPTPPFKRRQRVVAVSVPVP